MAGLTNTALGRTLILQGRQTKWVADHLEVARPVVSRWAHGHRPCPAQYHATIASLLGVPEDELFPEDEYPRNDDGAGTEDPSSPAPSNSPVAETDERVAGQA